MGGGLLMPGQLKSDAECPICGDGLVALVDTSSKEDGVKREYFHKRREGAQRRRRKCVKQFRDFMSAGRERRALEVRAA